MPSNESKTCALCGSKEPNLRTCTIRGAAGFRLLRSQAQGITGKKGRSRVCAGKGLVAKRCQEIQDFQKPAAQRRREARQHYTGTPMDSMDVRDRQFSAPAPGSYAEEEALTCCWNWARLPNRKSVSFVLEARYMVHSAGLT